MRKLLFLACVLMPVSAMAQTYTAVVTGQPGYYHDHHFEHFKWDQIHAIDAKIAQLQYQRQCMQQAMDPGMLHACTSPQRVVVAAPPPPPVVVVQPPPPRPASGVVLGVHIH